MCRYPHIYPPLARKYFKTLIVLQDNLLPTEENKVSLYHIWRREWQPTPVFLPGKPHGQRSLADCSPWGLQRVGHDRVTEHIPTLIFLTIIALPIIQTTPSSLSNSDWEEMHLGI